MARNGDADAWEILHRFLLDRKNKIFTEENISRAFRLKRLVVNEKKCSFAGIMESGEYGRANPIINVATGETTHQKTTREADMPPFYFRIHIPDGATTAVLALQRIGRKELKARLHLISKGISPPLDSRLASQRSPTTIF